LFYTIRAGIKKRRKEHYAGEGGLNTLDFKKKLGWANVREIDLLWSLKKGGKSVEKMVRGGVR